MSDKPHFRFNPGAYERGAFEASEDKCEACGEPCVWKFIGIVYTAGRQPIVCARCIADGGLARVADDYVMHDADFDDDVGEALADEVERRTPGFSTYNGFSWPVRQGEPLVFVGYGDDAALKDRPGVSAAIEALAEDRDEDDDIAGGYVLIFKQLDGDEYVAVLDLD